MKLKTILYSAVALCTSSCNLDYAPENTMVDETIYESEKTSEAALLGAYVCLDDFLSGAPSGSNNYPSNYYAFQFGDMGTDNLKAQEGVSTYLAIEKSEYSTAQHDGILYSVYLNGYNAIDYANNVIDGVEEYAKFSTAKKNQFIAEAKFIRAYSYLALLQIYGDQALQGNDKGNGLVLRLSPFEGYDSSKPESRATNEQVWNQIISDLKDNLSDLPEEVPAAASRIRANQAVAKALLSRVYLYKGTYTKNASELALAAQYAQEVLQTSGYTFSDNSSEYKVLFPLNLSEDGSGSSTEPTTRSSEIIFYEASRLDADWYPSGIYGYYNKNSFYVPDAMKAYYDENDVRGYNEDATEDADAYLLFGGSQSYNKDLITSMKYSNSTSSSYSSNTRGNNDVIYIRTSEMKLTRAEALTYVQNAVTTEAVDLLNDVHQRAFETANKPEPYKVSDFSGVDDFLKTLLKERNRELAYENHQRWDLIRTNNLLGDQTLGAVAKTRWNAPIPNHEVRITGGMVAQNSGYEE